MALFQGGRIGRVFCLLLFRGAVVVVSYRSSSSMRLVRFCFVSIGCSIAVPVFVEVGELFWYIASSSSVFGAMSDVVESSSSFVWYWA